MIKINNFPWRPWQAEQWAELLAAAGPRGLAWGDRDAAHWRLWLGMGDVLVQVHSKIRQLLRDVADPSKYPAWILTQWRQALGNPLDWPVTEELQREYLVRYLTRRIYGQNRAWWLALAAKIGVSDLAIDTPPDAAPLYTPLRSPTHWGWPRCGACVTGDYAWISPVGQAFQNETRAVRRVHARHKFL